MAISHAMHQEEARLRALRQEDGEALSTLRESAAQLKRENSGLRLKEEESQEELKWLREQNAILRYRTEAGRGTRLTSRQTPANDSAEVTDESAAVAAPTSLDAGTVAANATTMGNDTAEPVGTAGYEFGKHGVLDDFAAALNMAEQGTLPQSVMKSMIVVSVLIGSILMMYAYECEFVQWDLTRQLVLVAFLSVDLALGWGYAVKLNATSLFFIALVGLVPLVYMLGSFYKTYQEFAGADLDGDGDVDWHDRLLAMAKTGHSFSLFLGTLSDLGPIVVLGLGGFAFLWYLGFLQPVIKTLVVYLYCALLLMACLVVFIFKIWSNLNTSIMQFFEQFKMFQHQAEDIIQDIPDHVQRVLSEIYHGSPDVEEFDGDRTLANLHDDPFLTLPQQSPAAGLADVEHDPFMAGDEAKRRQELTLLCEFAEALFEKFKDIESAFAAFDTNKNGTVSKKEFRDQCRALPAFKGDTGKVFAYLATSEGGSSASAALNLRITKHDFRKLKDVNSQQASAKAKLKEAEEVLRRALNNPECSVEEMYDDGSSGAATSSYAGAVWALRRAASAAKAKAVPQAALLEVEHLLEEAHAARGLERAMAGGLREDIEHWRTQAQEMHVPKARINLATQALTAQANPAKKKRGG